MRYIIALLSLGWLSSCTGVVVTGIVAGSVVFVRDDFAIFQSHLVRQIQREVSQELTTLQTEFTNEVKIVQERKKVYAIGIVSSELIKHKVEDVVNSYMHGVHTSEIVVSQIKRNKAKDLYLKAKILNVMLFTKYVRSGNYKVLVYNEKAYVIGHAKNKEELDLLTRNLSAIEGIEDIVAYIV